MKIIIALLIAIILVTTFTQSASALGPENRGALKINTHVTEKPKQSCHAWTDNGWIVEPDTYENYKDYLEDFRHYFSQYPGTCKIQPETQ